MVYSIISQMEPPKSLFARLILTQVKRFRKILKDDRYFVFWFSLLFYFLLYFNLNNKTLLGFFFLFLFLFYKRFKDLPTSLLILYFLFLPIVKGKTFYFTLIPARLINSQIPYVYGFTVTFADLALLGLFVWLIKNEIDAGWRVNKLSLGKGDFFLFVFLSFVFVSLFYSGFKTVSFLAFLKLTRFTAAYFLIRRFLLRLKIRKLVPLSLAALLVFQGIWAGLQFTFQRPLGRSIEPFGDPLYTYGHTASEESSFFRAQGTLDHPNTLGSFLVMFLAFILLQFFASRKKEERKVFLASFLLGLTGLIFSASRASWVAFLLIGLLVAFFLKKHRAMLTTTFFLPKKWLAVTFLLLIIFLPFLVLPRLSHLYLTLAEKGGVFYRTYLLEKAWLLALSSPLGIGLATFPAVLIQKFGFFTWPAPVHNLFLEILSETGIFSLFFFLFFLIFTYRRFFISLGFLKSKPEFFLKTGAFFASLGFLVTAQFYPFFWASGIFEFFWLFLGIMIY